MLLANCEDCDVATSWTPCTKDKNSSRVARKGEASCNEKRVRKLEIAALQRYHGSRGRLGL